MEGEWASGGARLPALLLALLGLGPGECGGGTDTATDTAASRRGGCGSHPSLPIAPLRSHPRPNESFGDDPQLHPHPLVPNVPPPAPSPPTQGGTRGIWQPSGSLRKAAARNPP